MKSRIWEMKGVQYAKTLAQCNFSYVTVHGKMYLNAYPLDKQKC